MLKNLELPLKLFLITMVAGLFLGGTYVLTQEPIAEQNRLAAEAARQEAFAGATFEEMDEQAIDMIQQEHDNVLSVYRALDGSETAGYVIALTKKGYGGDIEITVGVDAAGKVTGVVIGNNNETAGLGANAVKPEFRDQFVGKSVIELVKGPGDDETKVSALTGATITSRAVTDGVNEAIEIASSLNEGEA